MPFGQKKTGATCQQLVNMIFKHQIEINVEAYVDDLLIMSIDEAEHIKDLL